jgi:hypothetical protein
MNQSGAKAPRGVRRSLLASPVRLACIACVVLFLWAVSKFYLPGTGFSSLILIGDALGENKVSQLKQVPHYIYEHSAGYDGAYYVQLALNPTLNNPELKTSIDNLPYRSKRILFCWTAWGLGLGQPAWIVQAHALINVICWLALAWVILRWFPPTNWENFLRWFGVMFSHGICMSVRDSLVDGPSLLLVALAMKWVEEKRRGAGIATLALAGLGKETSLLAVAGVAEFDWKTPRTWWRAGVTIVIVALPLLAWMAYIRWKFGPADDPGLGNFTLPLAGLAEKWADAIANVLVRSDSTLRWATLATVFAITIQWLFFVMRWRPSEAWWRLGAVYAAMLAFLSTPVWEGMPGAFTRVLLPMTLAFNIVVPRGWKWLPLLVAGNLTVMSAYREFSPPAREFYQLSGENAVLGAVRVEPASGWYGPETANGTTWRWSMGKAELRVFNAAGGPLSVVIHGRVAAPVETEVRISEGNEMIWAGAVSPKQLPFQFGRVIPEGMTVLRFESENNGKPIGTDQRKLAFNIFDLEVVVAPPPKPR